MALELLRRETKGVIVIEPVGPLDGKTSPELERHLASLLEEGGKRYLFVFSSVEYVSSAALRVLLSLAKKLARSDGHLMLASMNEAVREVFEISGFTRVFSIAESESAAIDAFPTSRLAVAVAGRLGGSVPRAGSDPQGPRLADRVAAALGLPARAAEAPAGPERSLAGEAAPRGAASEDRAAAASRGAAKDLWARLRGVLARWTGRRSES